MFFGLTEDIQKYIFSIDIVKEPEFSLYFQKKKQKIPNQFPSKFHYHRFSTEQYYCLNCFQKFFPEIKMEHQFDFNETNIQQSDVALANNFIFLEYRQHGVYLLKKCAWTKWSSDEKKVTNINWSGFYRHYVFLKDYKKYCNHDFKLPFFDWQSLKRDISNKIKTFFRWSIRPIFIVWCVMKIVRPIFMMLAVLKLFFKVIYLYIDSLNRRMLK